MPELFRRFAPAKINLALHVLGRRPDGFHELDTLVVFADIGDWIGVDVADDLTLSLSGPFATHAPAGSENLALRAAALLKETTGYSGGAAIALEKNLPAGAGLGGGSADAAAVLQALNYFWRLELGLHDLAALGQKLGADVPMCLHRFAIRARGTGERIERVHGWSALPLLLVWPGRPVSTAAVFAALRCRENPPLPDSQVAWGPGEMAEHLAACRNDLEAPALGIAPEIGEVLKALRATEGCLLARMSGSGSACFGLFGTEGEAGDAAARLRLANPKWWIAGGLAR